MPIDVRTLTPLLQVFDMPTSLAFYRDVLGFDVVAQSGPGDRFDWGLLKLGGATLMLNTAYEASERPSKPDAARLAAHEDTGLFFYCPAIDEVYALLRAKGLPVSPPVVQDYGMKQLYVKDPDGYAVCFQARADDKSVTDP